MFHASHERGPVTPGERNFLVFFLTVVLGLFVAEIVRDYQPVKLAALFILLFWIPLLALHEAGHAVAALLCGWYVARVVLGVGRLVAKFRLGTAVVEVRLLPLEGFVENAPRNLRHPRLKSALIAFAGPGAELLLLALVALAVGPSRLLTATDHIGLLAAQSLCLAILVSVVVNLLPHAVITPGKRRLHSDGLHILRSFTLPESHFAALAAAGREAEPEGWREHSPDD